MHAVVAPDRAHRLEHGLLRVHGLGHRGQNGSLAGVHGQDDRLLLAAVDGGASQAAIPSRHPDAEREVVGQRSPAEAGPLEHQPILGGEVLHGDVSARVGQDPVIAGDAHAVPGASGERVDRLAPRREHPGDQVGLAVGADDPGGVANQLVDAPPAVRRRHEGVARHARVARVDPSVLGAGVPLVDRGVVLHAGIGGGPGGMGDLVPDLGGREALGDHAVGASSERPLAVLLQHAVVGVLAGDGEVGLAVPVRVVLGEVEVGDALGRELQHLLDIGLGHHGRARLAQGRAERRIRLGIGVDPRPAPVVARDLASRHHRLEPAPGEPRARH